MTDTERLNLIEHYKWIIDIDKRGGFTVTSSELSAFHVAAKTLREAIDAALDAQIKWALP